MTTTTTPTLDRPPIIPAPKRRWRRGGARLLWPLLALGLTLLYNGLFTSGFFRIELRDGKLFGSLIDILNRGSPVMLLGLGMTLVIATGGIDLSVGAVMAIAGAVAAILIVRPEYSPLSVIDVGGSVPLAVLLAMLCAGVAGLFNGTLVALVGMQPIVATLILMVAGRGVAQLLTDGQHVYINNPAFEFIGTGTFLWLPFPITIVACAALLLGLLTRATALGLFIESVGSNPIASRYSGIDARSVKLTTYLLSGICAAVAGLIVTADIRDADANNVGLYLELDAILAAAIGGTSLSGGRFSLLGTIIGALVIQSLTTTILTQGVDAAMTRVIKAGVVVAVCMLQSEVVRAGLFRHMKRIIRLRQSTHSYT
ncbi:ABC transporter permease [Fontivita pretiosa]|uniref:ABC transporter permease n=1 Tax=Fontivita pretiosa TaxID=2989684 RepID=UPI003D16770A